MKNLIQEWQDILKDELSAPYMKELNAFVKDERSRFNIFPSSENVFCALNTVKPKDVNVVIIGQDPYHGMGQAHGLCFSVQKGTALPPSLVNIFKEIEADLGHKNTCGELSNIAKQGVLFLNTVLTVREGAAGSHRNKGWEKFTGAIIKHLNESDNRIIFVLWGGFAKEFLPMINQKKHLVLTAAHPSPLSAYNGFFGCRHFSKINEDLIKHGKKPIDFKTE